MRYSKHELSTISMLYSPQKIVNGNLSTMATFFCPQDGVVERFGRGGGGGGTPHMKWWGCLSSRLGV